MVARIEANLSSYKVEPFYAPRSKDEMKLKTLHNFEPTQYVSTLWLQRIEEEINGLTKNQILMMNKITNLERS